MPVLAEVVVADLLVVVTTAGVVVRVEVTRVVVAALVVDVGALSPPHVYGVYSFLVSSSFRANVTSIAISKIRDWKELTGPGILYVDKD